MFERRKVGNECAQTLGSEEMVWWMVSIPLVGPEIYPSRNLSLDSLNNHENEQAIYTAIPHPSQESSEPSTSTNNLFSSQDQISTWVALLEKVSRQCGSQRPSSTTCADATDL